MLRYWYSLSHLMSRILSKMSVLINIGLSLFLKKSKNRTFLKYDFLDI